ncbi:hypothetical protein AZH51_18020 [Branchiibius sp. NY16-3462-2]|nr:hypothetical protein AZH51_18020 [Branchiibius sp. NY16-3462-2]
MTYALDVAFVAADDRVLAVRRLPPWRGPLRPVPGAVSVLEAPAGWFASRRLLVGSQLAAL